MSYDYIEYTTADLPVTLSSNAWQRTIAVLMLLFVVPILVYLTIFVGRTLFSLQSFPVLSKANVSLFVSVLVSFYVLTLLVWVMLRNGFVWLKLDEASVEHRTLFSRTLFPMTEIIATKAVRAFNGNSQRAVALIITTSTARIKVTSMALPLNELRRMQSFINHNIGQVNAGLMFDDDFVC